MPNNQLHKQQRDLWAEACKLLSPDDQARVSKYYAADGIQTVNDTLKTVQDKQEKCMRKRWMIKNSRGRNIIVRDILYKIAHWISKFKEVGDVVVQIDPTHAALPWAAVRFLLQWSTNDLQVFATVAEGLELVSRITARYALFESVFLPQTGQAPTSTQSRLCETLLQLYAACLRYLTRTTNYYEYSTGQRIARSLVSSLDSTNSELEIIRQREKDVEQIASIAQAEISRQANDAISVLSEKNALSFQSLESLVRSLEGPLVRLGGPMAQYQNALSDEERQNVLLWLSTVNYRELHQSIYRDVIPGTGDWIFSKPEYQKWHHSSSSSILWLHGIPGCGKTKVTSTIVQKSLDFNRGKSHPAPVAYVYCSKTGSKSRMLSPVVILRTIVKQLSLAQNENQIRQPTWQEYSQRQKEAKSDGLGPSPLTDEECTQLLVALSQDSPATIFIDGLDEIDGNPRDLLKALHTLVDEAPNVIKVLVSSREDSAILEELQDMPSIRVSAKDNSEDIERFVQEKVAAAITSGHLLGGKFSSLAQDHLTKTLIRGAGEMFLWAAMQLEYLCDHRRFKIEADVLAAIQKSPPNLSSIFDALYARIDDYEDHAKQITKDVFSWLLAAECQMTASDIIMAMSSSREHHDENAVFTTCALDASHILDLCCNMIVLDDESMGFSFAHASIREYFQQQPTYSVSIINSTAARRCLEFFLGEDEASEDETSHGRQESPRGVDGSRASQTDQKGDFRKYVTCYWAQHYSKISDEAARSDIGQMIKQFLTEDDGICFTQWLFDVDELVQSRKIESSVWTKLSATQNETSCPVFMACVYGLMETLQFLSDEASFNGKSLDFNMKNSQGASPLYIAARYGHTGVVQFILQRGVMIDVEGGFFGTPLQAALFQGFESVVRILMEGQADPFAAGKFDSAVDAALAGGHESVIALLLKYKRVIETCDLDDLFKRAAYGGHFAVVYDLLDRLGLREQNKASDKTVLEKCHNAFQIALFRGRSRIAKAMLKNITNINEEGDPFGNALQAAAYGGHVSMIQLVLSHGAKIHVQGRYGTALRAAALGGHDSAVQLLIDNGATVGILGRNALEAAASNGRLSTVKLLLDQGLYNSREYTPTVKPAVQAACFRDHSQVAKFLLDTFGSDAAHHALLTAMTTGQETILQLALTYLPGITADSIESFDMIPCGDGEEPPVFKKPCKRINPEPEVGLKNSHLPWIKPGNDDKKVDGSLYDSLRSMEFRDGPKTISSPSYFQKGPPHAVRRLLDRGFDVNTRGELQDKPRPIEDAVMASNTPVVELLLDRGAEVGRALHYAVTNNNENIIRLLLLKRPNIEIEFSFSTKWSVEWSIDLERSALALSVEKNFPQITKILVDNWHGFFGNRLGFAILAAVRTRNHPIMELLLDGFELLDHPDDAAHSNDYFAIFQAMREAVVNRDVPIFNVLLQHVRNSAMRQEIIREFIRDGILHLHWYGVLRQVRANIVQTDYNDLIATTLLILAERREDPLKDGFLEKERIYGGGPIPGFPCSRARRQLAQSIDWAAEKEEEMKLLKEISHQAQSSEYVRSAYGPALRAAVEARNVPIVQFILDDISVNMLSAQSIVNSMSEEGETALYFACKNGDADTFNLLIQAGANPFTKHRVAVEEKSTASSDAKKKVPHHENHQTEHHDEVL